MFEAKNKTAAVVVITQATAGAIEYWWVIKAIGADVGLHIKFKRNAAGFTLRRGDEI